MSIFVIIVVCDSLNNLFDDYFQYYQIIIFHLNFFSSIAQASARMVIFVGVVVLNHSGKQLHPTSPLRGEKFDDDTYFSDCHLNSFHSNIIYPCPEKKMLTPPCISSTDRLQVSFGAVAGYYCLLSIICYLLSTVL